MSFVRTPTSAPLVRTSNGEAPIGVDVAVGLATRSIGSSVIVAPRASLLCMPVPAPKNNSVLPERPDGHAEFRTADAGVHMSGIVGIDIWKSTEVMKQSPRQPSVVLSQSVH